MGCNAEKETQGESFVVPEQSEHSNQKESQAEHNHSDHNDE